MLNLNNPRIEKKAKTVQIGDKLTITPIKQMPNLDREITVQGITAGGFLYGITETSDGYEMPFWAIDDFKVVK